MSKLEGKSRIKISIYLAYHKRSVIFKNNLYRPIHVGAAGSDFYLEMERDDIGDNISLKNGQYAELTAVYWAWKNDLDSNFIGIGHYRRIPVFSLGRLRMQNVTAYLKYVIKKYFVFSLPKGEYFLSQTLQMCSNEFIEYLNDQEDCIQNKLIHSCMLVPRKTYFATHSVRTFFNRVVSDTAFKDIELSISNHLVRESFIKMQNGNSMYIANIFVMRRDLFNEFCEFLFGTLENFVVRSDKKGIKYSSRFLGYVGELLTSSYIMYLQEQGVSWNSFDLAEITDV
jgi:hypothetical protein